MDIEITNTHVERYLSFIRRTRDLRATTLENYAEDLGALVRARASTTTASLSAWISTGSRGPVAATTRNRRLVVVRGLMHFLIDDGLLQDDPTAGIRMSRVPIRRRRALTRADLRRVLEAADQAEALWVRERDRALVHVFFYVGLRLSELHALDLDQVDLRGRVLLDVNRKGGHRTDEYLPRPARAALARYLELRPQSVSPALFLGTHRNRLSKRGLQLRLARLGHLAGLGDQLHPHALRYAHATELDRTGASIAVVQQSLCHASVQTTRRYIQLSDRRLSRARDRLAPLERTEPTEHP